MASAHIIESRKIPSLRPDRRGQFDCMIVYNIDGKREQTFVTVVPADQPTDQQIQAAIRADQATRQAHIGKQIPL